MTDQSGGEIEESLFQSFLEEADEMLQEIEEHSQELDADLTNESHIHGIFRAVHSLKGNSSFFNFTNVQTFCHTLENYLDLVRSQEIEIDKEIVKFILEGADYLKNIFNRLNANRGVDVTLTENEAAYLSQIDASLGEGSEESQLENLRKNLLVFFSKYDDEQYEDSPVSEMFEIISKNTPFLLKDKRKRTVEDGTKWLYADLDVTREYLCLRALINDAMQGGSQDEAAFATFTKTLDSLIAKHVKAEMTGPLGELNTLKEDFEMFYQDAIGIDEMLAGSISTVLDEYAKGLTQQKPEPTKAPSATAPQDGKGDQRETGERRVSFVRVEESLLDVFIDYVGELITLSELFNYIQRRLEDNELNGVALNFKNTNQSFRELSNQLQKSLYVIRKTPVERALAKLPRLVRNIAREKKKNIRLECKGGDTEIDKSLLEKIETILVHLVRNSADHGIETPKERAEAGKREEGLICIDVSSDKANLIIEISDNGSGVDVGRIRQVAVEKGFVSQDAAAKMPDSEALNMILKPGFSTAQSITETSGRGVGMDVLSAGVHEMGGTLLLDNSPGEGLRVKIVTPLAYTTRIKLGLTLAVGSGMFLIPAENVRESFRAKREDVSTVEGKGEVVQRWGKIYPAVRLHALFKTKPRYENIWDGICVLTESRGSTVCLVVDEMMGQRQIVYKQLTVQTKEPSAFEGVSILDGTRMALILSVEGILKQFLGQ